MQTAEQISHNIEETSYLNFLAKLTADAAKAAADAAADQAGVVRPESKVPAPDENGDDEVSLRGDNDDLLQPATPTEDNEDDINNGPNAQLAPTAAVGAGADLQQVPGGPAITSGPATRILPMTVVFSATGAAAAAGAGAAAAEATVSEGTGMAKLKN